MLIVVRQLSTPIRRLRTNRPQSGLLPAIIFACLTISLLTGCTASWQAPMESRGGTRQYAKRPAAPPRSPTPIGKFHQVRPGDTLYGLAWQAGTDYRTLAGWNRIRSPYVLKVGQTIRMIPPPRKKKTAKATPPKSRSPSQSSPVVVKKVTRPTASKQGQSKQPTNKKLTWGWPAKGRVLSTFSAREPSRKGVKISGRLGQPIYSTASGRVVYSGSGLIGYGRLIIVKHNERYLSAYGHNDKLLVKEGDQVKKGQQIARMGKDNSGQSMLHFEIRRGGKPINPQGLLPRR